MTTIDHISELDSEIKNPLGDAPPQRKMDMSQQMGIDRNKKCLMASWIGWLSLLAKLRHADLTVLACVQVQSGNVYRQWWFYSTACNPADDDVDAVKGRLGVH